MPDFLNAPVQDYLDQLASGAPTPGGGSAAGLSGAMAAGLLSMSALFTIGRDKYLAFQEAATMVQTNAEGLRVELQHMMEEDSVAYAQYRAASSLPKETSEEQQIRQRALQDATHASAQAPLVIARHCYRLLELAGILAANCNPNLVSDVAVAAELALAGFRSAILNVRLNLRYLDDADFVAATTSELGAKTAAASAVAEKALTIAYQVMNLPQEGI